MCIYSNYAFVVTLFFFFVMLFSFFFFFFFSSRRRHTRWTGDWSSDVCSSDLAGLDPCRFLRHTKCPARRKSARPYATPSHRWQTVDCPQTQSLCHTCHRHLRSEERRVGKECRSWWSPCHHIKNTGDVTYLSSV